MEFSSKYRMLISGSEFENVICKISAILFRPQLSTIWSKLAFNTTAVISWVYPTPCPDQKQWKRSYVSEWRHFVKYSNDFVHRFPFSTHYKMRSFITGAVTDECYCMPLSCLYGIYLQPQPRTKLTYSCLSIMRIMVRVSRIGMDHYVGFAAITQPACSWLEVCKHTTKRNTIGYDNKRLQWVSFPWQMTSYSWQATIIWINAVLFSTTVDIARLRCILCNDLYVLVKVTHWHSFWDIHLQNEIVNLQNSRCTYISMCAYRIQ